jgi:type I restriction enzyme S subunit
MMSYKRYEKYKDSGVEWIGEVPEHWEVVQLKWIIKDFESGVSVNAVDEPANLTVYLKQAVFMIISLTQLY